MFFRYSSMALLLFISLSIFTSGKTARAQEPTGGVLIEEIEIRGNRRLPKETILYSLQSKAGDPYREEVLRRDFEAILNLGYFDPMQSRILAFEGARGGKVVVFEVREYPIIRDIQYHNLKSVSESDVITRFRERRVSLSKETPFDPVKAQSARKVIRELLAEKGHPDATIEVVAEEISATAVAVNFEITEGPLVRVKEIIFTGRTRFAQSQLRRAMKYTKEAGLLASFTSKDVYFKDKLEADLQQVRFFLGNKGYLQTVIGEPLVERVGTVIGGFPVPFLRRKGPGLRITIPMEVGRRYKVSRVEEKGVTLFPSSYITAVTGLRVGEYATARSIQDGVYKNIKDLYGERGYIQASAEFIPVFRDVNEDEGEVEVTLEVDEGKQFTLRRLEFIGNNTTRDTVLRREIIINEGDPYSKRFWDLSVLRLNQLGLFEEIKDKDAITRTNDRDQTVDLDLQVKERGRQQIQLNGGVSGIQGSFFGLSYSTNNLFGFGQTVSASLQYGSGQANITLGYVEPYLLGRPISLGINLFAQRQQYYRVGNSFISTFSTQTYLNAGNLPALSGLNQEANKDTIFTQNAVGGSVDVSASLSVLTSRFRRYSQFARAGVSYSLFVSSNRDPKVNRDDDTSNDVPVTYRQPRILTSRITPNLFYNTLNSALDPTRGQSLYLGLAISGGLLGGDVKTLSPTIEYKHFRPLLFRESARAHVFGLRFSGGHIRTFGRLPEKLTSTQSLAFIGGIPVTDRYFLGGEQEVRGYNFFSVSPVARYDYYRSTQNVVSKIRNASGEFEDASDGSIHPSVMRRYTFEAPEGNCARYLGLDKKGAGCNVERIIRYDEDDEEVPFYTAVGGDTRLLLNLEYRVPIAGPVAVAGFLDAGTVFNLRKYNDQIVSSNYVDQTITPEGVILNSSGVIATRNELDSAIASSAGSLNEGLPPGFRRVYLRGDSRTYNVLRISRREGNLWNSLAASVGVEIRVQLPMINVPFRLILAHNPNAKTDFTDPKNLSFEQKSVVRFSVGRTF